MMINNIHLVNTIDLDSVLLKEDRVDWIKINVEGHEMDKLEGACKPFVCINQKSLLKFGYRLWKKPKTMIRSFGYSISIFTENTFF
jgi:hypothetical protein